MTFIRITNDCSFFNARMSQETLYLTWNKSLNLSSFNKIALREIQIGPLTVKRHDTVLKIQTNIIARTLFNPLRELTTVRVSRNSSFIDGNITPG